MNVKKFVHSGRCDQNRRLFALIGEFCASATVRKALGCSISSQPGQVWYVAVKGRVICAFGSIRLHKSSGLLRHLYSPTDDPEAWEAILRHCIEHARRQEAAFVQLTDYLSLEKRYAQFGFWPQGSLRGRFTQYVLTLENPHGA